MKLIAAPNRFVFSKVFQASIHNSRQRNKYTIAVLLCGMASPLKRDEKHTGERLCLPAKLQRAIGSTLPTASRVLNATRNKAASSFDVSSRLGKLAGLIERNGGVAMDYKAIVSMQKPVHLD